MRILLLNNIITTAISEVLFVFQKMSGCLLRNKSVHNLQNILATVLPVRAESVGIQKDRVPLETMEEALGCKPVLAF